MRVRRVDGSTWVKSICDAACVHHWLSLAFRPSPCESPIFNNNVIQINTETSYLINDMILLNFFFCYCCCSLRPHDYYCYYDHREL